ncbi:molybdopterin molybdotransferase MoeA [Antarcticirhabdus aurantiaca]|uniref:Molybdopterin molybdotransferase MoeA n=1 Tax=Antarcticirhabdus aurantiaca TaxID=2606717 RepID=A0ACD4NIS7_9HYPH|nr:gephyrin-like molybdotransferase Glp [Antarcticirhabdus aurantiaca]WAJ26661.1 molybdopterin molybdotransferase MoeA [Jeongeuplla avenae]
MKDGAATVDPCFISGGLTPQEALALVLEDVAPVAGTETLRLAEMAGRVVSTPIRAPRALPPFDHSAMDGYALALPASGRSWGGFRIVGTVVAGRPMRGEIAAGEAVRIFTGAAFPLGCDAVVMQEHVDLRDGAVFPRREVRAGDNVRLAGEDVAPDEILLREGTLVDARHLALLAASGIVEGKVARRVRVTVISTGTELRALGENLSEGAIYDSNRVMLLELLRHPGVDLVDGGIVPDEPSSTASAIAEAAVTSDLVITSGGVSVGEQDFVRRSVEASGGSLRPLKMGIKPGKPLAFGRLGKAVILGLPGNPLAALVGFLLVGRHLVARLAGATPIVRHPLYAVAGFDRNASPGRFEYAPAAVVGMDAFGRPVVDTLGRGGSARLLPLTRSDGFCVVPPGVQGVAKGDMVEFVPMATVRVFA